MTASISPCWKKPLSGIALLLTLWLLAAVALAGSSVPQSAALVPDATGYAVEARFVVDIGPRLAEAVNHGVPLHFRFEVQLKRKRWYWIDEHVAGRVTRFRLAYQPLTRQYRLASEGSQQNFDSLEEALQGLGRIAPTHVAERTALPAGVPLAAAVRLSLDTAQLPKPLQVDALADSTWEIEAGTLRWEFVPGTVTPP